MIDGIAERIQIGGTTIRSISDIAHHQLIADSNEDRVAPNEMLTELCADNQGLTRKCVSSTSSATSTAT